MYEAVLDHEGQIYEMKAPPCMYFERFCALEDAQRGAVVAYAVSHTLAPQLASAKFQTARQVVEELVLPDLRDAWTPDADFLRRLSKPDLLTILSKDLKMPEEALGLNTSKKTEVVEYMAGLFAEPFATLPEAQREAVQHWCPEHMQTTIRTADESAAQAA